MLNALQDGLETLYGLRCEARAEDFLVTAEQALLLGGTGRAPEEMLVREGEDGMEVALYLSPELLEPLSRCEGDLPRVLEAMGLDGFCTLTEGVSHFMYLSRAFDLDRHVSLLELEAQAEVDKFAVCVLLRWSEQVWARQLVQKLFDEVRYRPELSADERSRYVEANRLSRNYCQGLLGHVEGRRRDRFLSEIRYAYRLGAEAKLQHLARRREMIAAR